MRKLLKHWIIPATIIGFLLGTQIAAVAKAESVIIEITRDIPEQDVVTITRQFLDLDDLSMWFANRVENGECDPYVTRIILYPQGKGRHLHVKQLN